MVVINPDQVEDLAERLVAISGDQPHEVFVSALIRVLRSCGDAFPCCRHDIGRTLLLIGGRLIAEAPSNQQAVATKMPASTSIH